MYGAYLNMIMASLLAAVLMYSLVRVVLCIVAAGDLCVVVFIRVFNTLGRRDAIISEVLRIIWAICSCFNRHDDTFTEINWWTSKVTTRRRRQQQHKRISALSNNTLSTTINITKKSHYQATLQRIPLQRLAVMQTIIMEEGSLARNPASFQSLLVRTTVHLILS